MPTTFTAEAIVFTINSAIKLGKSAQRAYANSLQAKSLVLPLPDINKEIKQKTIEDFFKKDGKIYLGKITRLDKLHETALTTDLTGKPELDEYRQYYITFFQVFHGKTEEGKADQINSDDLVNLFRIRQWQRGEVDRTTVLQLVAGNIVEIGIDYFNQVPGALNTDSAHGRALKSVLAALDEIPFSEKTDDFKRMITRRIVPQLFIAAVETIGDLSTSISQDEKVQKFFHATAKGITEDLYQRLESLADTDQRDEAVQWGQMIVGSMIKNAGEYVFSSPSALLQTDEAESALIRSVGTSFLSLILDESTGGVRLKKAFNKEALDGLVSATLKVTAEFPELITAKSGLREVVGGVSAALAESGINRPDLLPELARLVLENTALNLDLLSGIDESKPRYLLVSTIRQLLLALSAGPASERWKPRLTKDELLGIAYEMVDEVVDNPSWVTDKVNGESLLGEVLQATFSSLAKVPREQRLNTEVLTFLIQTNLRTVAKSKKVLDKIQWAEDHQEVVLLNKVLDLAFDCVFPQGGVPGANKPVLLMDLVEYILEVILSRYPDDKGLILAHLILSKETGIDWSKGFHRDRVDELLQAALEVINQHPQLITQQTALQKIVADTAASLHGSNLRRPDLLPELVRLVLQHTAGNLDLLIQRQQQESKHLLVTASQQILGALAQPPAIGKWRPRLSTEQILDITDFLFQEVIDNPEWVRQEPWLRLVLESAFQAIEAIPTGKKLPAIAVEIILRETVKAVNQQKQFLINIPTHSGHQEVLAIQYSLESLFVVLYQENDQPEINWMVSQTSVIDALTEYFLAHLAQGPVSTDSVDQATEKLRNAFKQLKDNLVFTLEELLKILEE